MTKQTRILLWTLLGVVVLAVGVLGYMYKTGKLFSSASTSYPSNMGEMEIVFRLTDANNQRINVPLGYSFTMHFRDQYGSSAQPRTTNYCYGQPGNEPDTLRRGCVYRGIHARTLTRYSKYTIEGHCPNNPAQTFSKEFIHNPYQGTKNIQYIYYSCTGKATPTATVTTTRTQVPTATVTPTSAISQTSNAKINVNASAGVNKPTKVKASKLDSFGSSQVIEAAVDSSWSANFTRLPIGRYKFYVCDGGSSQVLVGTCSANNNKGSKTINVLFGQFNNTTISYGVWQ